MSNIDLVGEIVVEIPLTDRKCISLQSYIVAEIVVPDTLSTTISNMTFLSTCIMTQKHIIGTI